MLKTRLIILMATLCGVMLTNDARAAAATDETALFTTSTAPDALIVLDLSGSMAWNPAGDDLTYGSTDSCSADTANCSGTGCSGGFCANSKSAIAYYASGTCSTPDTTNCVGTNCANGFCSSFEERHVPFTPPPPAARRTWQIAGARPAVAPTGSATIR